MIVQTPSECLRFLDEVTARDGAASGLTPASNELVPDNDGSLVSMKMRRINGQWAISEYEELTQSEVEGRLPVQPYKNEGSDEPLVPRFTLHMPLDGSE